MAPETSKIPTPNVDKLIGQGMKFTNVHSGSSDCTPTRYVLLTGAMLGDQVCKKV